MKSKISWVCQECGYESAKFLGKCPECGEWNTLREFKIQSSKIKTSEFAISQKDKTKTAKKISEISYLEKNRISTGFAEADGVLGGGMVPGSVTLLAGDPGIGKSTLLLQIALNLSSSKLKTRQAHIENDALKDAEVAYKNFRVHNAEKVSFSKKKAGGANVHSENFESFPHPVLYISGEESEEQIKMRAQRIGGGNNENLYIASLNDTDRACEIIGELMSSFVIVDSIQTMESEKLSGLSGSVGQVRYGGMAFIKTAKTLNIPTVLVGHVTKEGMVAGPMVLSHMVDTLLFFEGEKFTQTRILRSLKNRFGPVDEVGIFKMDEKGLSEVKDIESLFITEGNSKTPGSVLTVTMEGTRPFLVEIQALCVFSKLPIPRRVASGIDSRRLELLIAVLQKQAKLPIETMDIFVNIAGGLKLSDPASDLAVCLSIFSSFKNLPLWGLVAVSEVGLLGELRNTSFFEKRVKEAQKMGFKKILSAKSHRSLQAVLKDLI
ncbi:MAG: hypothetical protein A2958_00290 [Candidatus Levybacteria bacterium RIFCSPLOWO2_01_FULL_38_13]|nr:MAG: hypothetical protein A2629_02375 [Candidatus Levybacteria bacterium RIFCSPHIGHO2_01_FULL_41_15]OGH34975.1 MAG: hypothetical protein A2958_00290 [Candidatus Levybacteria bacterium RIFCSPLOWO2_01_FULL_38_13]